jgi:hypothetical protein
MTTNLLRWAQSESGYQFTTCGQYWVERDSDGGWYAHNMDETWGQLFTGRFKTKREAKEACELDAREYRQ